MVFLTKRSDGGKDSTVTGYWLIEIKGLFTIALLRFSPGSRENYHSHAFNALSWYLGGGHLIEHRIIDNKVILREYTKSIKPKYTPKTNLHKVYNMSDSSSWVFTIRGPWAETWMEYNSTRKSVITLGKGRKVLSEVVMELD